MSLTNGNLERILFRTGLIIGIFIIVIVLSVAMSHAQTLPLASSGTWTPTGTPYAARTRPATALLASGKLLVAGPWSLTASVLSFSELYQP